MNSATLDIARLGKQPIAAHPPAGVDVKDDPLFEQLQAAVRMSAAVLENGGPDWAKVVDLSARILSETSKDLLVAGYLAVGLVHTGGAEGFLTGAHLYLDLIETYWDSLYPAKSRGPQRAKAIGWWVDKTASALQAQENLALSTKAAAPLRDRLEKAHRFLMETFPTGVSLRRIADQIDRLVLISTPDNKPVDRVLDRTQITSEHEARLAWQRLSETATLLSDYCAARSPSDPQIYRLNRIAAWIGVLEVPPAQKHQTLLPSPDAAALRQLVRCKENGQHEALIAVAERIFQQHIFWLDAQRWTSEALNAMGGVFLPAAKVIQQETCHFVNRLKGIETLCFSDGMPFADAATQEWLQTINQGGVYV